MVTGPQRRREKMSEHNSESNQYLDSDGYLLRDSTICIRDTILLCKVEGMQTTAKSVAKIELHLASIAKSFASIDQSLAIIAAAQTKLEEK
jgi:hypothetical protein